MTKVKKLPNDCSASDVGAARLMAVIVAVGDIFSHTSCGQFGHDGLQRTV